MNKKVNVLNIIVSVLILGLFIYGIVTKGEDYSLTYGTKLLYISAGIDIVLLLFSLFKIIRDSIWMDIIYMIYLLKNLKIYGLYIWYPKWIKYFLIVLLIFNIVFFILSFRGDKNE